MYVNTGPHIQLKRRNSQYSISKVHMAACPCHNPYVSAHNYGINTFGHQRATYPGHRPRPSTPPPAIDPGHCCPRERSRRGARLERQNCEMRVLTYRGSIRFLRIGGCVSEYVAEALSGACSFWWRMFWANRHWPSAGCTPPQRSPNRHGSRSSRAATCLACLCTCGSAACAREDKATERKEASGGHSPSEGAAAAGVEAEGDGERPPLPHMDEPCGACVHLT